MLNPNLIRVPLKSKRQLQNEFEESNRYRVLRLHYDVSDRIDEAIKNAKDCIEKCRNEILSIVDFMGEQEHPVLQGVRIKLCGYTQEEE